MKLAVVRATSRPHLYRHVWRSSDLMDSNLLGAGHVCHTKIKVNGIALAIRLCLRAERSIFHVTVAKQISMPRGIFPHESTSAHFPCLAFSKIVNSTRHICRLSKH